MPIPFLLAGLGLGAAVLGVGGHLSAKETNERAQQITEDAQRRYNNAKRLLENAKVKTEKSLLQLGYSKKKVLETSVNQFLVSYERIKNIELSESIGLDEIKNFTLEKQDALQLREMSDIYQSTFSSGAAGAATGAVIALAASGSLPVVTGMLSTAGTALMAGEIGMAAGMAGSALSLGAAMTPLAAIAAPVVLFSGISASIKADENLEKANTMYAEAEAASEQMKTSEVLCVAIADRADMFNNLLYDLDAMFSQCTALLDGVTRKKMGFFKNKTVDAKNFSEDELRLVAVTRALAGAVKAVIDTPILTAEGTVSNDSQNIYDETTKKIPAFSESFNDIKSCEYNAKPIAATTKEKKKAGTSSSLSSAIRNVFATVLGAFMFNLIQGLVTESFVLGLFGFAITTLLIMNNDTKSLIFKLVKNTCYLVISVGFIMLFYDSCIHIVDMNHYIIGNIIIGVIAFVLSNMCISKNEKKPNNLNRILVGVFGCTFFFTIAVLVFAFLYRSMEFSYQESRINTAILYAIFALLSPFLAD